MIELQEFVRHAAAALETRYSEVTELAHGQSGIVFSAHAKEESRRRVAIKVAHPHDRAHEAPDSVIRFRRESEIGVQLHHARILRTGSVETIDGFEFYEMDLPGPYRLDHLVLAEQKPTFDRMVSIMREIGDALDYAHSLGIVHGALHPSDVLLDGNGHAHVKRFYLEEGKKAAHPALLPSAIGDPAYMAPEQWRRDAVDRRVDVYAAGVLAYELCTGERRVIYDVPHLPEIRPIELPAARPLRDGIPVHVNAAIRKATSKDPKTRYESVGAFVSALTHPEEALGHSPHLDVPPPPKRSGSAYALMALVTVAMLAAFFSLSTDARDSVRRFARRATTLKAPEFDPLEGASNTGARSTASISSRLGPSSSRSPSQARGGTSRDSTLPTEGSARRAETSRRDDQRQSSSLGESGGDRQQPSPDKRPSSRVGEARTSTSSALSGTSDTPTTTGILKVSVDQGRVMVFVNGIPRGLAPLILNVSAGNYRVSVKGRLKYDPTDMRLKVSLGDTAFAEFYATDEVTPDTTELPTLNDPHVRGER